MGAGLADDGTTGETLVVTVGGAARLVFAGASSSG